MRIQGRRMCRLCNRFLRYELLDIEHRVFVGEIARIESSINPF